MVHCKLQARHVQSEVADLLHEQTVWLSITMSVCPRVCVCVCVCVCVWQPCLCAVLGPLMTVMTWGCALQAGGALIGPHALGIIQDVEGVRHLAELGVVFLLFNIGLELSLERLRSMQKYVFGMGTAQVRFPPLGFVISLEWPPRLPHMRSPMGSSWTSTLPAMCLLCRLAWAQQGRSCALFH